MGGKRIATIDNNIELHLHKTANEHRDLKVIYRNNSFVSATVKNIVDFGVFLVTNDEYRAEGLLHINKFQDKYIKNIEEYISVGDKIDNLKIIRANSDNKLEFSSMHLTFEKKSKYKGTSINNSETLKTTNELMEIKKVLMNKVGVISKEAEDRLIKIIKEQGQLIPFTMAMGKVIEDFQVDLGLLLIKEIENKMSDCL
ncbi:TPA: S1 RNA-binding domain-containing protein [Bacillus pacificus]|uniref:S1 RNA-binding domain-containing protein n=1 Tax=Bacillus cereus group TaxID=86661 RepID=UPI00383D2618|nr:S1 RNA-binding domain-containing protein [Bacillus pacificus]